MCFHLEAMQRTPLGCTICKTRCKDTETKKGNHWLKQGPIRMSETSCNSSKLILTFSKENTLKNAISDRQCRKSPNLLTTGRTKVKSGSRSLMGWTPIAHIHWQMCLKMLVPQRLSTRKKLRCWATLSRAVVRTRASGTLSSRCFPNRTLTWGWSSRSTKTSSSMRSKPPPLLPCKKKHPNWLSILTK